MFLLVHINCTKGFHCDIPYIHIMNVLWSNSPPLLLFLISPPPLWNNFNNFHCSIFTRAYDITVHIYPLRSLLLPSLIPSSHPQTVPILHSYHSFNIYILRMRESMQYLSVSICFISLNSFIHFPTNNIISFFFMSNTPLRVCVCVCVCVYLTFSS
jgi:hypothetical protein